MLKLVVLWYIYAKVLGLYVYEAIWLYVSAYICSVIYVKCLCSVHCCLVDAIDFIFYIYIYIYIYIYMYIYIYICVCVCVCVCAHTLPIHACQVFGIYANMT